MRDRTFTSARAAVTLARMTRCAPSVVTADLTLRFGGMRLRGRVCWPGATQPAPAPLVLLVDGADELARRLAGAATAVVLAVADRELDAMRWAAEHAADLGAQPTGLLVAGERVGAARAAALAIAARDAAWPALCRQVLLEPRFTAAFPMPSGVAGVAPATIVRARASANDGGCRYAARLRAAGVAVDELRDLSCLSANAPTC
jgi:hypothetical protein